jgi:hypothetical protein
MGFDYLRGLGVAALEEFRGREASGGCLASSIPAPVRVTGLSLADRGDSKPRTQNLEGAGAAGAKRRSKRPALQPVVAIWPIPRPLESLSSARARNQAPTVPGLPRKAPTQEHAT